MLQFKKNAIHLLGDGAIFRRCISPKISRIIIRIKTIYWTFLKSCSKQQENLQHGFQILV